VNTGDILHAQDDEKEKYEKNGGKDFFREEQEGVTLSAPLRIALATQDLVMISLLLSRGAYSADLALEHIISGHEWTTPSKPLSGLDVLMPPVVPSNDSMDPLPLELVQVVLIYRSYFHPSTLGKMLGRAILLDDAALVSLLLKAGANLDFDGTSSFAAAFSNSSAPVVNVLLEYGADPKVPELAKHLARGVSSS
jgi:ankyrin repeat protein